VADLQGFLALGGSGTASWVGLAGVRFAELGTWFGTRLFSRFSNGSWLRLALRNVPARAYCRGVSIPQVRHPLPRAHEAVADRDKWIGWILAARGHGDDWSAVFGVGPDDWYRIWELLRLAVHEAPVAAVRDRGRHGLVCEVRVSLEIDGRAATVITAWHLADENSPPRLVTAYPRP
jgi:hypothetical protein